uniref:DUF629 domain-containing protein n=1 Tax=Oryza punctata TaxID=4537 RepID=A0A0E0MGX2_ORYPU
MCTAPPHFSPRPPPHATDPPIHHTAPPTLSSSAAWHFHKHLACTSLAATSSPRAASSAGSASSSRPLRATGLGDSPWDAGNKTNPSNMDWNGARAHPGFRARVEALTGPLPAQQDGVDVKEERLHEAVKLTVDFHSPLAYHVLGHVRAALGEDELALDSLDYASKLAPGDLDIAFTLAKRYAAREQFDLAAEECQRALSLGDADLVDPELHAVFEFRDLKSSVESRISMAKQPLRDLLDDALSKIAVLMACDCWNGMSEEKRRSFLTVSIEEMKAPYRGSAKRTLTSAVDFAKDNGIWICWLCPQCEKRFPTSESFLSHVEVESFPKLKASLLFVPKRISKEQAELIESWTVPSDVSPKEQAEREEILSKIKSTLQHLKDQKALSVDLLDNLVKLTKNWIGETTAVPQHHSCITKLHPVVLRVLDLLISGLRTGDAKQDDCDQFDAPFVPSIVIEENMLRITDGSSNQDALFSWLCRHSRQDAVTSWSSIRQACLDKGTHALKKLNECTAALIEKVQLKSGLIETQMGGAYFCEKAKIDVEIMQLDAKVDNLKKNLVEVCICDYREIILPAMKDFLWAKLCNDPPKGVSSSEDDKAADASIENRDPVQEDINEGFNINSPESVLQEDDGKATEDNLQGGDSTVPHDNGVEELPGDSKVSRSGKKLELPPRANTSTLGSTETPMEKANKTSSPSDYSGSNEGSTNIPSNGVTGSAYPNSENDLKSLFSALLSLWHLRPFSDKYMKKAPLYPHFGVSGEDRVCMLCYLFHTFNAFSDKSDSRANNRLNCLRPSFIKVLEEANVSLKEETNFAVKYIEIVLNMVHTSETAICINNNSENILYKTTLFSSCPKHRCLSHEFFGMHKNATESTYFLNVGASELQNIEMKTFADVIKSVDKQFHCNTESNAHNHPPRYFTTAFSYPSENDSHFVSGLLVSIAAPLDINPVYEGLHSECKYTMVSAVFRAEGRDICFAREEDKWLEFDSWEKVLEEYSRSSFCPQIIFFERIDPVSEAMITEVTV